MRDGKGGKTKEEEEDRKRGGVAGSSGGGASGAEVAAIAVADAEVERSMEGDAIRTGQIVQEKESGGRRASAEVGAWKRTS